MNKKKRIAWLVILYWLGITEFVILLLDIIMSTVSPEAGSEKTMQNIDFSFLSPFLYISCWSSFSVVVWAISKIIDSQSKMRMSHWLVSRNNSTFIVSMSVIMFFIYAIGVFAAPSTIVGADTWYKIVKSSIEHCANPIILIVFYLVFSNEEVKSKEYAIKWGWFPLIFTTAYIVIVILREVLLVNYADVYKGIPWKGLNPDGVTKWAYSNGVLPPFPYAAIDPFTAKPYIWILAIVGLEAGIYGVCNLFNLLGNVTYRDFKKRNWLFDIYPEVKTKKTIKRK